jgi:SAM-dependent methyltransferase
MDARYWERVGADYETSIFDSAKMDRHGVVLARLREHADTRATACDFGCGIGHYLPLLAPRFRRVFGFDFAHSLLSQAAIRCQGLDNVSLAQADLAGARARLPIPKVRFGVCANVLISEDVRMRRNILRTVHRHLANRGHALFVVPSLESVLWSNSRLVEWNERLGYSRSEALDSGVKPTARNARELLQGLVRIDGVLTKHYLREEALVLLAEHGFEVTSVDKVEYGWETEFDEPPRWMRGPGPWDWLLVARKRVAGNKGRA